MSCPPCAPLHPQQVACSVAHDSALLQGWILPKRRTKAVSTEWGSYYADTASFIRMNSLVNHRRTRIVELGTAFGGLADALLSALPLAELIAVDPFIGGYDMADETSHMYSQVARERTRAGGSSISDAWATALAYEQSHAHRCRYALLHNTSRAAAVSFEDGSVDVLFIDGLHTYSGVAGDLRAWWPKVRSDGLIILNDMPRIMFLDVTRAAVDFISGLHVLPRFYIGDIGTPPGQYNTAIVLGETDANNTMWDALQRLVAKWPAPPGTEFSATQGLLIGQSRCLSLACIIKAGGSLGSRTVLHDARS